MPQDEKYIKLCFELAEKGRGYTSPNPVVGCVIVKNNKIIGKGYHTAYGKPHAEIEAIQDVLRKHKSLKGATLYVNMEPCVHWGKTPPCVDSIIKYGIKRVVCSMLDPNPLVNGKGIKKLISSGVKCDVGIFSEEAKELNKFYLKWIKTKLPYVTIKSAVTFDGKIATFTGDSKWISSENTRNLVYKLRSKYDAILVGINTVINDNPSLTSHGLGRDPIRIVIGDIKKLLISNKKPTFWKIISDGKETIFLTPRQDKNIKVLLENYKNVKIVEFSGKKFDFNKIKTIPEFSSITSILVEGGGETNWEIINSGIVDEFILFICPKIFGGSDAKTFVEGEGIKFVKDALSIKFVSVKLIGQDIMINGRIK